MAHRHEDCSTIRMISSFSAAGYLTPVLPSPKHDFFHKTVLEMSSARPHQALASRVPMITGTVSPV